MNVTQTSNKFIAISMEAIIVQPLKLSDKRITETTPTQLTAGWLIILGSADRNKIANLSETSLFLKVNKWSKNPFLASIMYKSVKCST